MIRWLSGMFVTVLCWPVPGVAATDLVLPGLDGRNRVVSELIDHGQRTPIVCAHFRVRGQVQGVFYRASTEAVALRLGLTGWVRNDENGDVELVACGNEQQLQAIEVWLWRGPAEARVSSVQRTQVNRQNFDGFTVNR